MNKSHIYEEVGHVLDYSKPNLVTALIVFLATLCFVLAIIIIASRDSVQNKDRWWRKRSNIPVFTLFALPLVFVVSLFALGERAMFPKPSVTSDKLILAESVWKIADRSLSDTYNEGFRFSRGSEIGDHDEAKYRWATPRSYKLEFTANINGMDRSCQGYIDVSLASYDMDELHNYSRLSSEDGRSISKASKVTVNSSCN